MDDRKKITQFTDLIAWKEAQVFVVDVYNITKSNFPKEELFGLTSQIRRAAVSVTSNISEGFGRHGYQEKLQFYRMARGSLNETVSQLYVARDIGYINDEVFVKLISKSEEVGKLLSGLIRKTGDLK